jgi:hypothetical protein
MNTLFDNETMQNISIEEPEVKTIIGGIYRDDNDDPDYDGCYALTMGRDAFAFLFEGINHIEEIVEIGCAHKMRLIKGYGLAYVKKDEEEWWMIRDSSKKYQSDYIIAKGKCGPNFKRSLNKILKVFHK